jgi:two-component system, LytTR family, response regulator LytT
MRILIIEDEAMAARMLKNALVSILGDAIDSIQVQYSVVGSECFLWERPVDLLFLDLDVDGRDGFELLKCAMAGSFHTIVVSGHGERALEAFEYGVLDFIQKPFSEERIRKALERYERGVASGSIKQLSVVAEGAVSLVPMDEVSYFQACDKRSFVCRKDGRVEICNKLLQDIEKLLPSGYMRIHRSFIVKLSEIRRLSARANGRYFISMRNGVVLPVSRAAYRALKESISL